MNSLLFIDISSIFIDFLGLDPWVWIPGFGLLGLDSWVWSPGLGFLGLDSWVWSPGFGVLGLDSWIWTPGLNLLPEVIKPMIWSAELQIMTRYSRSAYREMGEPGPETRFFLQALHKLARALQVALPW